MSAEPLVTPDGRYLVVRGRLWRRTDPRLDEATRTSLVHDLMEARRAKKTALAADDAAAVEDARARVDAAKTLLGERGPVWWDDDAPDDVCGARDVNGGGSRSTADLLAPPRRPRR